jgi:hypothetical protein
MTIEFTGYEPPRRLASTTYLSAIEIRGRLRATPEGTQMRFGATACTGPPRRLEAAPPAVGTAIEGKAEKK